MNVLFSKTAWEQYKNWQSRDEKVVERIHDLIKMIQREPYKGIGKPEPLRQNLKGYWSRRITSEHRLVYRITGLKNEAQRVEILTCEFYYKK